MTKLFLRPMPAEMVRQVRENAPKLRPSEIRVLAEVLQGKSGAEIERALGISYKTVGVHIDNISRTLGCTRYEMIRIFSHELADDAALFDALSARAREYDDAKAGRG
jgi:DNA-binding CsgD family transcriptional regulator